MGQPATAPALASLTPTLRALGSAMLPPSQALDEEGWRRAESIIEQALASRPPGVKRQLRFFLRAVNLLPLLSAGRTLRGLSPQRRVAFLERQQRTRLRPVRRGVWGIRTLLFMGYYRQEPVRTRIGYRAASGGWSVRGEGA